MRQTIYIKHKYKKYNTIYTVHHQGSLILCPPAPTVRDDEQGERNCYKTRMAALLAVFRTAPREFAA